jgi:hypothetical protein
MPTPQEIYAHYAEEAMRATNDSIDAFNAGEDEACRAAIKELRRNLYVALQVLRKEFGGDNDASYINFDLSGDE